MSRLKLFEENMRYPAREENALTPYSTDRSICKPNKDLNMCKTVVAWGSPIEEKRKNLVIVETGDLECAISRLDGAELQLLKAEDTGSGNQIAMKLKGSMRQSSYVRDQWIYLA
jgi:hypothetical protein